MMKPRHARIWIEGRPGNPQDATLKPLQADDGSAVLPHNPVMQVVARSSPTGWPGQTWPDIFSTTNERPESDRPHNPRCRRGGCTGAKAQWWVAVAEPPVWRAMAASIPGLWQTSHPNVQSLLDAAIPCACAVSNERLKNKEDNRDIINIALCPLRPLPCSDCVMLM